MPTANDFAAAIKSGLATDVEERIDLSDYTWDLTATLPTYMLYLNRILHEPDIHVQ